MKTAVTIPDDVFAEAEFLAKALKTSRSEIYSRALAEFVGRHAPDRVTKALNEVIAAAGADTDQAFNTAVRRVLRQVGPLTSSRHNSLASRKVRAPPK
jgi:predicted transcriptional regulator